MRNLQGQGAHFCALSPHSSAKLKAREGQETPAELFIARGAAGNTDQLVQLEQPMLSLTPKTNVFPSCTSTEACELHSMLYDDLPASDVSYDAI